MDSVSERPLIKSENKLVVTNFLKTQMILLNF